MRFILSLRDALGRFYGEYDTPIRIISKFALALLAFTAIRTGLGQMAALNHPLLLLALSAVCAFLPSNSILLIGTGMLLGHFYGISLEAAIVGGGIAAIAMLLYFSMTPQSALPLILTALTLPVGLGCVPAMIFGLIGGPLSAVGVAFGVLAYYLVRAVAQFGGNLQATSAEAAEAMLQKMAALIHEIITQKEMFVMMVALAAALLVVYFIRTAEIRYAWMVGAAAGCFVYAGIRLGAAMMLGVSPELFALVAEVLVSLLAVWIAQVMLFSLDYQRTENVRFEDDDYYYYVKAVPKMKVRRKKRRRRSEGR